MEKIDNIFKKPKGILFSINELKSLMEDSILKLEKMEWWLLKNDNLYRRTKDYYYNEFRYVTDDGQTIRLPDSVSSEEDVFISLFDELDEISTNNKLESYFEKENNRYYEIDNSKSEIKKWVAKNEKLGAGNKHLFSSDSLDIVDNQELICIYSYFDLNIFTDSRYFKHTIKFSDIFYNQFWVKKVYPESKYLVDL